MTLADAQSTLQSELQSLAPRYQQLAALLMLHIEDGRFTVGARLPPEWALAQQHGVSRHTVREAIRQLAERGVLTRRQGIGTTVTARNTQSRFVASLSSPDDLFQYTQRTRLKVIESSTIRADSGQAARLRVRRGSRWLRFSTRRYPIGSTRPISYTEIYVQPAYAAIAARIEGPSVWVYGLIEELYGERIVEVEQDVGVVSIDPSIAKLLGVKAGSPGLHVVRFYSGANARRLSMSVNIYPEDRFRFSTRWRMEWNSKEKK